MDLVPKVMYVELAGEKLSEELVQELNHRIQTQVVRNHSIDDDGDFDVEFIEIRVIVMGSRPEERVLHVEMLRKNQPSMLYQTCYPVLPLSRVRETTSKTFAVRIRPEVKKIIYEFCRELATCVKETGGYAYFDADLASDNIEITKS